MESSRVDGAEVHGSALASTTGPMRINVSVDDATLGAIRRMVISEGVGLTEAVGRLIAGGDYLFNRTHVRFVAAGRTLEEATKC